MLLASGMSASMEIAAVVAPVALYFLVLGLLLSGRMDFAILTIAISPLLLVPLLNWLGLSLAFAAAAVAVVAGGALVLVPRGQTWVLYNVHAEQARSAVAGALRRMGLEAEFREGCYLLGDARVQVSGFSPLRNATIRLLGGDKSQARRFERAMWDVLRGYEAQTSPMAVSLLLVAATMLVAPLALMAHRVPEIVRILTDLIH
jgi:hypothetical protein